MQADREPYRQIYLGRQDVSELSICDTVQGSMAWRSVNTFILVGRLGKDAETTYTPSGVARSRFTVATSRRWKDTHSGEWKEETEWATGILGRGENVATSLHKGKQVSNEGPLRN